MPEIGSLNRALAKEKPETVFARPSEVLDEVMLTSGEKLAMLERWRQSLLSQLRAADDGMATRGVSGPALGLLEEIEAVSRQLRKD